MSVLTAILPREINPMRKLYLRIDNFLTLQNDDFELTTSG